MLLRNEKAESVRIYLCMCESRKYYPICKRWQRKEDSDDRCGRDVQMCREMALLLTSA